MNEIIGWLFFCILYGILFVGLPFLFYLYLLGKRNPSKIPSSLTKGADIELP